MTKAELIEEVAKVASLTKKETELIVNTVFDNITDALGKARVGVDQRGNRVVNLFFHQAAHGQQVATHLFQLSVELRRNMVGEAVFVDHVHVLNRGLTPLSRLRERGRG